MSGLRELLSNRKMTRGEKDEQKGYNPHGSRPCVRGRGGREDVSNLPFGEITPLSGSPWHTPLAQSFSLAASLTCISVPQGY